MRLYHELVPEENLNNKSEWDNVKVMDILFMILKWVTEMIRNQQIESYETKLSKKVEWKVDLKSWFNYHCNFIQKM